MQSKMKMTYIFPINGTKFKCCIRECATGLDQIATQVCVLYYGFVVIDL